MRQSGPIQLLLIVCLAGSQASSQAPSQVPPSHSNPITILPAGQACVRCHAEEVAGFSRSKMAHSLRLAANEPSGTVSTPGTTITMSSDAKGSWQQLESAGDSTRYRVSYVIGSGTHATGYLIDLDNHLFQSPVAFYTARSRYGLAPGFENKSEPDFTRPVREGCLFCHAGSFTAIPGTVNQYSATPFQHLSISCDRCHGPVDKHLAKPVAANIINPGNLEGAARDSVCEQCHLIGAARILNPGKRFSDFQAGQPLENTFTVYHYKMPPGTEQNFRVISHSEQLALSACSRNSNGSMWCGTCHNPHAEPTDAVPYYRRKCLACHASTTFTAGHPALTSDCIGCHMPKRSTSDGGHTAFTDHRIQRRPQQGVAAPGELIAWREPAPELAKRNLGMALIEEGVDQQTSRNIIAGYRLLTEVQNNFQQDSEMFNTMGAALLLGRQYSEAQQAFALAVQFDPASSPKETSLASTYVALGDTALAQQHLERALDLDPLNLEAVTLLMDIYTKTGNLTARDKLSAQINAAITTQK